MTELESRSSYIQNSPTANIILGAGSTVIGAAEELWAFLSSEADNSILGKIYLGVTGLAMLAMGSVLLMNARYLRKERKQFQSKV